MQMRSRIGITMGDPAGIGPEIILKTLGKVKLRKSTEIIVIGNYEIFIPLKKYLRRGQKLYKINKIEETVFSPNYINLLNIDMPKGVSMYGKWSKWTGIASFECVKKAIELANSKKIDGIVTAPICKQSWDVSGVPYMGHTEVLVKMTKTKDYSMMFVNGPFRVALVTIHQPLRRAIQMVKKDLVIRKGITVEKSLRKYFGITHPKIAVAGINPHAGEQGILGKEEIQEISPAIRELNRMTKGTFDGPFPPDTLFTPWMQKKYDLMLCLYHDQGLIPFKMVAFNDGVNVTAGIPFVRTSPDHGTAFNLAGKGKALPNSMIAALQTAEKMILKSRKGSA